MVFTGAKTEIESALAEKVGFDGKTLLLKIPAYPEQGEALRDAFHDQLFEDFPNGRAEQILAKAIVKLEHMFFRGFGIAEQSFSVTQNPDGLIHINRFMESEKPLQSHEGLNYTKWGSSSYATATLESLRSGEFRPLLPLIERHFTTGRKTGQPDIR
jgi:hypothetical protein